MQLGYAVICEEHTGRAAVNHGRLAAGTGFDYVSVSDHFHPWLDEQGQSPFAWSVLGALATAVPVPLMSAVTCPIGRYHPLIVAQAAATVAELSEQPFVLGLGSGEALNEHVVGGPWRGPRLRHELLVEAVDIIRTAWDGEEFSHAGEHFVVDRARLYTLPDQRPTVAVAAGGPAAAQRAAELGGGMVTVSPDESLVAAYRDHGGEGPLYAQATLCWAPTRDEAAQLFRDRWRQAFLGWTAMTDIATPAGFDQATQLATADTFRSGTPIGPDPRDVQEDLDAYRELGYDGVAVHCVGPYQEEFIDWSADALLTDADR